MNNSINIINNNNDNTTSINNNISNYTGEERRDEGGDVRGLEAI